MEVWLVGIATGIISGLLTGVGIYWITKLREDKKMKVALMDEFKSINSSYFRQLTFALRLAKDDPSNFQEVVKVAYSQPFVPKIIKTGFTPDQVYIMRQLELSLHEIIKLYKSNSYHNGFEIKEIYEAIVFLNLKFMEEFFQKNNI